MSNDYFNLNNPLDRNTLGRAEQVNAILRAIEDGFDLLPAIAAIREQRVNYYADGGTANTYAVTFSPALTAYTEGLSVVMKAANTNTGASTLNVNALGVKAIKRYDGTDLEAGDITAGGIFMLVYDGTNFRLSGVHGGLVATVASDAADAASSASAASSSASAASSSASTASTAATNAGDAQTAAEAAQAAAETAETGAENNRGYAEEWANKAEDSLISAAAGGNESDEYSALHHAAKAAGSANAAANSQDYAEEWANKAEDSLVSAAAGGDEVDDYSALHHAAKAAASATSAGDAQTAAEAAQSAAETAQTGAETARTGAEDAQSAAESARDSALAAYDQFDDRYLGAKASDPTLDNDGNALVAGALYYNTSSEVMRLYTGSAWVAAYVSGDDYLAKANNLSGLTNVATARSNLGLGTAAVENASAFATAAQGSNADTAFGWGNHASAGYAPINNATFTGTTTIPTADINGGAIDGATIGGASAAAGTFTTFTSNGIDDNATSTAITIDSNEQVGIGDSSPAAKLDLVDTDDDGSAVTPTLRISNGGSGTSGFRNLGAIGFGQGANYWYSISAERSGGIGGGALRFNYYSDGSTPTERVRIDGSGNVGIGTSSPTEKLEVRESVAAGSDAASMAIVNASGQSTSNLRARLVLQPSGYDITAFPRAAWIEAENQGTGNPTDLLFYTNETSAAPVERMRIDSGGNVGIGTSSPTANLHVAGNMRVEGSLTLEEQVIEHEHTLSGTNVALDPANGTIQTHALSGTTTYTDSFSNGESITLFIDSNGNSVTWPTMEWVGGSAPTLENDTYNVIVLWHFAGTLYGSFVGVTS